MTPLVSCLMVTRDRRELAARAVACFAQQTWPERELVIVDDGDQDYSPVLAPYIAEGYRIRYLRGSSSPSTRLGALRNVSQAAADGDWCMQWDDDEWYHPDRITVQMSATDGRAAVALRWTLAHVRSPRHGDLVFRTDCGLATPGSVLFRRGAAQYRNLARSEDSVFLRDVRRADGLVVLGDDASHLFVRCFHGANTWDEGHFLRRLRRRARDVPHYAYARWWHRDLRTHPAFRLDAREQATADAVRSSTWSARS